MCSKLLQKSVSNGSRYITDVAGRCRNGANAAGSGRVASGVTGVERGCLAASGDGSATHSRTRLGLKSLPVEGDSDGRSRGAVKRAASRLFLAAIATACGGTDDNHLPADVHWSSAHFDYYTRAGDSSVCESVTETLERHRKAVIGYLGLPDGDERIDYRKFRDARDYLSSSSCPDAGACTVEEHLETPLVLDEHELIHAYLRPVGRPPALLAEGVAQALSCLGLPSEKPDARLEWRDAVARGATREVYPLARWFVGYLLSASEPKVFLELYAGDWSRGTPDEIAKRFESAYGRSLRPRRRRDGPRRTAPSARRPELSDPRTGSVRLIGRFGSAVANLRRRVPEAAPLRRRTLANSSTRCLGPWAPRASWTEPAVTASWRPAVLHPCSRKPS